MYAGVCHDGMRRYSGDENQTFESRNLFVYRYGVGISSRIWHVPLSDSGYAGTFQDKMHIFSTVIVVLLSIVSLIIIIIAGARDRSCRSYGVFAAIALGMMMVGAMGMNIVPKDYFGIVERFSVFAATGYNAVLGIELFRSGGNGR